MTASEAGSAMSRKLAQTLYTEALVLADEMRAYFDAHGRGQREELSPRGKVLFACESLKATTRLMHVISWLATRRAIDAGEMPQGDPRSAERQLAEAQPSAPDALAELPTTARQLILSGIDLYERVGRLATGMAEAVTAASPARMLMQRLERAF